MIIIDGKGAVMGRLASYAAKELLKGEEISIINCSEVIVTGNKVMLKKEFEEKRSKFGSSQKGPKIHRSSEKVVKRAVRGMLPNHRIGRGREAFKRIKCYNGLPKELEGKKVVQLDKVAKIKIQKIGELVKKR